MKIKRTLPSVLQKIKERKQPIAKPKIQLERQFNYNRQQIDHISVINETQKREHQKLVKQIMKNKPKIFKERTTQPQKSDKFSTAQSTSINSQSTYQIRTENNPQFERVNSSRSLFNKENNMIYSNDSTIPNKKRYGVSGDKCRKDIGLEEKVYKLQKSVQLLQKKLNFESLQPESYYIKQNKKISCQLSFLEQQRNERCQNIIKQNILLSKKLGFSGTSSERRSYMNNYY